MPAMVSTMRRPPRVEHLVDADKCGDDVPRISLASDRSATQVRVQHVPDGPAAAGQTRTVLRSATSVRRATVGRLLRGHACSSPRAAGSSFTTARRRHWPSGRKAANRGRRRNDREPAQARVRVHVGLDLVDATVTMPAVTSSTPMNLPSGRPEGVSAASSRPVPTSRAGHGIQHLARLLPTDRRTRPGHSDRTETSMAPQMLTSRSWFSSCGRPGRTRPRWGDGSRSASSRPASSPPACRRRCRRHATAGARGQGPGSMICSAIVSSLAVSRRQSSR